MTGSNAKVKSVRIDEALLTVWLDDGRIVSVPLAWYPALVAATPAERKAWQASGAGRAIHWPALDYDLSVVGLLAGRKEHPNALRYSRAARPKALPARRSTRRAKSGRRLIPA